MISSNIHSNPCYLLVDSQQQQPPVTAGSGEGKALARQRLVGYPGGGRGWGRAFSGYDADF